jgi:deazaflavin-dependent oxidoreductase (nitroreductase family)
MAENPNDAVIAEFRANDGVVGGYFEGMPLVLLHHTGAKSGTKYVNPVAYLPEGDGYAVFASKAGHHSHPGWYHNLIANPDDVTIEVGNETLAVHATEITGAERDRIYAAMSELRPQFAEYEDKTTRTIPVVLLTPAS